MAFGFQSFLEELEANFRTYDPVSEAETKLEGLCMHESHQATKYFIKFQQLAAGIEWGDAASIDRLTMDSPNISKTIWSTTTSQPPSQDSENLSKLSMHDTGNEKENSPMTPKLPDNLETSPNRSLTPTGQTTSPAKVLPIPSRTTTTPALPRARAQLPNKRSPPLPTFLQNSGKMES